MCGRATVINPEGITEKVYGFTRKFVPSDWKPRYNLNPRDEIPAVYYDPFLRQRVLRTMHWNLIPSHLESRERVDEFDSHYSTFNARIESVASAPTFRDSWRSQRCLVVVDGIIEWIGNRGRKVPHLIRQKEHTPFAMAGLWSRWSGGMGDDIWSCAVIVSDADHWYSRFHDRMAVLVAPGSYDGWLDPSRKSGQLDLLKSAPSQREETMEYFPISTKVNNPKYDAEDCLEEDPEPPPPLQADLFSM
jgi:putative SOS response-associated peptidase YedK